MKDFKKRWEIQHNWQLLFPIFGFTGIFYSAFKIANIFNKEIHVFGVCIATILIGYFLLRFILFLFKKLEKKWVVEYKWEMIRIFIIFAITGSSSVFIGRPFIKLIGITKENLNPLLYWVLYVFIGVIFYQILLVILGWLLGQHKFFWEFEKKMIRRFGLGKFLK